MRGCEISPELRSLEVRWTDPERFYGKFNQLLLQSGVPIFEVRSTASVLEKANEPPPLR